MAFKFKTFAAVGALIGSLALVGCGQDEKDPNSRLQKSRRKLRKTNMAWTLSW